MNNIRFHNLPDNFQELLEHAQTDILPSILSRDASVWSDDAAVQTTISNRLGWLDSPQFFESRIGGIEDYAANVRADGITDIVLLGMGGSSLAPEVCRDVLSPAKASQRLHVLDNTHPEAVAAIDAAVDLSKTLFVVASKSGSTTETSSFQKYFFQRIKDGGLEASRHFCAITDPDSDLANEAVSKRFRDRFLNPADIGGRYSAISYFGLVPSACAGIDIKSLVSHAQAEVSGFSQADTNVPALVLGVAMAACFKVGRDKMTLHFSEQIAALGVWVEQLVAESTGKQGIGIVPVVDEASMDVASYGDDRLFVVTSIEGDPITNNRIQTLVEAGHPVVEWSLTDTGAIGAEFVRWEMATAVAGAGMGINPFDEPNVTESKNKTRALLESGTADNSVDGEFSADSLDALIASLDSKCQTGDYFALLAYVGDTQRYASLLEALRVGLGKRLKAATTLGYGPRFLHSTGQLHKGGANNGHFLQLVAPPDTDLKIPEQDFSFAELNRCQALGDYQVLLERERRVSRLNLGDNPLLVLGQLIEKLG